LSSSNKILVEVSVGSSVGSAMVSGVGLGVCSEVTMTKI
jgi:hypothetical protein